ncbi:MFS transporter [Acinetobacter puyangensis]|uniref:MFS transporter, MHS family, proline/betaine transporter n=1 Tax=Acinetobacter puyangensis TaxID=1096779 RepID=A0A240E4L7_9GAMM|nr:MFS transporter [Acinetobacter puyangensis]SNX43532.1 MFS transporter, MHS family, proline/betaine transporter [Acinetobacter puyangensis]
MLNQKKSISRRSFLGLSAGNFLEWLDFTLYGYFALAIAHNFFPAENEILSTLAAITTFAVGFLVRPIGAYLIGNYADRKGRKSAMVLTVMLMGLGTLLIACAPSYQQAGYIGTTMVVLGRLVAGLAASGEFGAAVSLVMESCPKNRRGFYSALFNTSTYLALATGSGIALLIYGILGQQATLDWGWRIGFFIGLIIIPVGLYLRRHMEESNELINAPVQQTVQNKLSLGQFTQSVILVASLSGFGSAIVYLVIIFMPSFAKQAMNIDPLVGSASSMMSALIIILGAFIGGMWSDKSGRIIKILLTGTLITTFIGIPLYEYLLISPSPSRLFLFQIVCSLGLGLNIGAYFPFITDQFPTRQRALGIGLGYNIGVTLFGAVSPIVTTYALSKGILQAPAVYLLSAAMISISVLLIYKRKETLAIKSQLSS